MGRPSSEISQGRSKVREPRAHCRLLLCVYILLQFLYLTVALGRGVRDHSFASMAPPSRRTVVPFQKPFSTAEQTMCAKASGGPSALFGHAC